MLRPNPIVFAIMATMLFGSCAVSPQERAQHLDPMLVAAGFKEYPADSPQKTQTLQNLPPLKMRQYTGRDGTMHYWLADPYGCQCIFHGGPDAYQRYEALKLQDKMVREQQEAAEENMAASENMMLAPIGFGPGYAFGY
jgi:hypothetical protein